MMDRDYAHVECPTLAKREVVMDDIISKIQHCDNISEKIKLTFELRIELDALLACNDFDRDRLLCADCHLVAKTRKKTAAILIESEAAKMVE